MLGCEDVANTQAENTLVRAEFEFIGPNREFTRIPGARYRAEFNPAQHWRVERWARYTPGKKGRIDCEVAYQETDLGVSFPERIEWRRGIPGARGYDLTVVRFGPPRECRLAAEAFTLSHYGIPESVLEVRTPGRMSLLIMVNLAVIIFIVAILTYRRLGRQPQRGAAGGM